MKTFYWCETLTKVIHGILLWELPVPTPLQGSEGCFRSVVRRLALDSHWRSNRNVFGTRHRCDVRSSFSKKKGCNPYLLGAFVVAAFKNPDKWLSELINLSKRHEFIICVTSDQDMRVQTEVATPRQFVALLEKASGKSIKIVETDAERFEKARSLPNVEELWSK